MGRISEGERRFIEGGIAQDLRSDGRGRLDYRRFSIHIGVIPQASGSARLRLGATDVLATVKVELGSPSQSKPNQGRIEVAVELSATADPEFEGWRGEEYGSELSKALERYLQGGASGAGAAIDLTTLCIVEGRTCWVLYVDILVLNTDGNLLDASAIAIKAAMADTQIPKVEVLVTEGEPDEENFEVSDNPEDCIRLDTSLVPLIITLSKVGKHYIADATEMEDSQLTSSMSIAVNSRGNLCGVTKWGAPGLDPSVMLDMFSVARRIGRILISAVDAEIIAAQARAEMS